ncbi:MAG TPA: efflux RND transporter periplasmic adaptor subunit [Candidatus Polarisedimenticolia bacterium]|jgi:cobalt-zinc-cadmium efflux system membrane fusion protein|nr:efflux RND transporter periplasmic adaptor subunit [Candidatus Polarisedimenticolia bacterium]
MTRRMRTTPLLGGAVVLWLLGCGREPAHEPGERPAPRDRREVVLAEDAARAAGIDVVTVSREAFHPHVVASGVIRPVAQKSVVVRSPAGGRVVDVGVDVGDRVAHGRVLCRLEGSELTAALARHRIAAARAQAAKTALERGEKLLELKGISGAEVEVRRAEAAAAAAEGDAARRDLARLGVDPESPATAPDAPETIPVTAPRAGVVLSRSVSPGLLVPREAPLFEIADLAQVWAIVDVYEKDLGEIRGQGEVEIRTDAYPGEVFPGRIALVEPVLDEASRTAHVRVVLDNRAGRLLPGLFVTAAVPLRGADEQEATAVPAGAVQTVSGLPAVFVATAAGRYELRPVEIGREAHGMVEIRHGLKEGERVVAKGAFVLKSELLKGSIEGEDH